MSNLNCKKFSLVSTILPAVDRIIAIGDIHGDANLMIECLEISKVIIKCKEKEAKEAGIKIKINNKNRYYKWIGGKTVVVQIGDQNDSCRPINGSCDHIKNDKADDINILKFFTELHNLAKEDGGAVYSLLGNHEIMNVNGNFTYTSNANVESFRGYVDPRTGEKFENPEKGITYAFSNGNEYAVYMGCTRQSILIIGDFLFVHAGLENKFLKKYRGRDQLSKLNNIVKNWLLNNLNKLKEDPNIIKNMLNSSEHSPFWTRILGQMDKHLPYSNEDCQKYLAPILEAYKIKGMVIGHTPQMDNGGVNSTCDNKLFRIDFGGSKAFDSMGSKDSREPQVLEILKLKDGSYKYNVIFQKKETYDFIVPDDDNSFKRIESRLPN